MSTLIILFHIHIGAIRCNYFMGSFHGIRIDKWPRFMKIYKTQTRKSTEVDLSATAGLQVILDRGNRLHAPNTYMCSVERSGLSSNLEWKKFFFSNSKISDVRTPLGHLVPGYSPDIARRCLVANQSTVVFHRKARAISFGWSTQDRVSTRSSYANFNGQRLHSNHFLKNYYSITFIKLFIGN